MKKQKLSVRLATLAAFLVLIASVSAQPINVDDEVLVRANVAVQLTVTHVTQQGNSFRARGHSLIQGTTDQGFGITGSGILRFKAGADLNVGQSFTATGTLRIFGTVTEFIPGESADLEGVALLKLDNAPNNGTIVIELDEIMIDFTGAG